MSTIELFTTVTELIKPHKTTDLSQRVNAHCRAIHGQSLTAIVSAKDIPEPKKAECLRELVTILETSNYSALQGSVPRGQVSAPASAVVVTPTVETTPAPTGESKPKPRFNAGALLAMPPEDVPDMAEPAPPPKPKTPAPTPQVLTAPQVKQAVVTPTPDNPALAALEALRKALEAPQPTSISEERIRNIIAEEIAKVQDHLTSELSQVMESRLRSFATHIATSIKNFE